MTNHDGSCPPGFRISTNWLRTTCSNRYCSSLWAIPLSSSTGKPRLHGVGLYRCSSPSRERTGILLKPSGHLWNNFLVSISHLQVLTRFLQLSTMNSSNASSKFVDEFQNFVIVVVTHGSRVSSATPVGSSHATSCLIFECWRINAKLKLLKFVIRFSQFWLDAFFFKTKCN